MIASRKMQSRNQKRNKVLIPFILLNILSIIFFIDMFASVVKNTSRTESDNSLCVSMDRYDVSQNKVLCSRNVRYDIMIMINSAVGNWQRRLSIRKTWGNPEYYQKMGLRVRVLFVIGINSLSVNDESVINKEKVTYKDVLMVNVQDTYRNNIFKHMFGIYFVQTHCDYEIFMKVDDDVYVQVEMIRRLFKKHYIHSNCLWCYNLEGSPVRDPKNKWFIDEKIYNNSFPRYCMGSFYVTSSTTLQRISNIMQCYPFFWIDDVHVTGLLRTAAKVRIAEMPIKLAAYINVEVPIDLFGRWINKSDLRLVYHHKISPDMINLLWNTVRRRESMYILPVIPE